jgi:prolyl-tRNA editing enzyme YbaK/EbsC (Cys-tRNA(Pro) deacylase)
MEERVARFVERARVAGLEVEVREMSDSTHTAAEAAAAVGAPVAAIVKSLLFLAADEPLLVLASGPNRVDVGLLSTALRVPVTMADAKTVKRVTGSSIGGVPPICHPEPIRTIIDTDLLELDIVWAAAASTRAVFPVSPARLAQLASAEPMRVS